MWYAYESFRHGLMFSLHAKKTILGSFEQLYTFDGFDMVLT